MALPSGPAHQRTFQTLPAFQVLPNDEAVRADNGGRMAAPTRHNPYHLANSSTFRSRFAAPTASEPQQEHPAVAAIGALHKAGLIIVPGSDTGLVRYGLLRELELYVQAGITPLEAIQCATIVSARAMNLDRDSGTVEPGKRADLILVDGNPLANISDLRKVSQVVANGRLYVSAKLCQSVGFRP
jgi:imidazolonepropionase-like amidohydrolase